MKKESYVTPSVELIDCMVEQGFAGSKFGKDGEAGGDVNPDPWTPIEE